MLQQQELKLINAIPEPFHIYMIGARPKISLDIETLIFSDQFFEGKFLIQVGNKFEEVPFKVPNYLGAGANVRCESNYPYTHIKIYSAQNELLVDASVAILMNAFNIMHPALDLEILYIGQSYGIEGARTAPNRLINHSTLQEIYADVIRTSPDKDVWIILGQFEQILITSFDPLSKDYGTTDEEDKSHIKHVLSTPISKQQEINFTEAALIRYFEPYYNDKFKYSFPNPAHTTYVQCYELDLNTISVEVNTEELNCRLKSDKVKAEWIHIASFPLHSSEKRKEMFDFFS